MPRLRFALVLFALVSLDVRGFSAGSTITSPVQGHMIRRPCQRSLEISTHTLRVASAAFASADDPQRTRLLNQCDCGKLRGCRCGDSMWDTPTRRDLDPPREEEGMDDQGYRQLGYY